MGSSPWITHRCVYGHDGILSERLKLVNECISSCITLNYQPIIDHWYFSRQTEN